MSTVFPSTFRANLQTTGGALVVGAFGVGISAANHSGITSGDAVLGGQVAIGANAILGSEALHVTGDTTIVGTTVVNGATELVQTVEVGSVYSNAAATTNGDLGAQRLIAGASINAADLTAGDSLYVDGNSHLDASVRVTETALIGSVYSNAAAAAAGDLGAQRVHIGSAVNAASATTGSNDLYVEGDTHLVSDLYLDGDLFMSGGGLQIDSLVTEVVTLNSQNDGVATAIALAGGSIPNSGMVSVLVAGNDPTAVRPTAHFIASKTVDSATGTVSRIFSQAAEVSGAGNGAPILDMAWNSGDNKPVLFLESGSATTANHVASMEMGVTTTIATGPAAS
jgi:hypothetical protein